MSAVDEFVRALESRDSMQMNAALDRMSEDESELAQVEELVNALDEQTGMNKVHALAASNHEAEDALALALCIDTLVRRCGADVELRVGSQSAYRGFTALLLAAHFDDDPACHALVFMALVRAGAQIDARSDDGHNVAHVAAATHNTSVLQHLAQLAVSPADSNVARIRAAVAGSVLVTPISEPPSTTPLMIAAARGAVRSIAALIDGISRAHGLAGLHQALAATDDDARTCLHHAFQVPTEAVLHESYVVPQECVDGGLLLLAHADGALDIDAKDRFGVAAADFACDSLYAIMQEMVRDGRSFLARRLTTLKALTSADDYALGQQLAGELRMLREFDRKMAKEGGGTCQLINTAISRNYGKMRRGEIPHITTLAPPDPTSTASAESKCPFLAKKRADEKAAAAAASASGAKCPMPSARNAALGSVAAAGVALGVYAVYKLLAAKAK